jgi:hypothetical protein
VRRDSLATRRFRNAQVGYTKDLVRALRRTDCAVLKPELANKLSGFVGKETSRRQLLQIRARPRVGVFGEACSEQTSDAFALALVEGVLVD